MRISMVWAVRVFVFTVAALCSLVAGVATGLALIQAMEDAGTDADAGIIIQARSLNPGCDAECVGKIREARSELLGIEERELKYVLREYNRYVHGLGQSVHKCLAFQEDLKTVSRMTLYPEEFLGGLAFFESGGCRNPNVRTFDNGYGLAQVTSPSKHHIRDAAIALGIPQADFNWKRGPDGKVNVLHNVMLGAIMLDDCEETYGSRGVGILCYNRGKGGVRKDLSCAGWKKTGSPFGISDFRGCIPVKIGAARPRTYVDRFLAGVVLYTRAKAGQPLTELTELKLADIPGADPARDGEDLQKLLAAK